MKQKILLLYLITATLIQGCKNEKKLIHENSSNDIISAIETKKTPIWEDSLIIDYIKHNKNEKLKYTSNAEWLFDGMEKSDSTNYYVYQIGHSVSEPDGAESRWIINQWIYIDSATHILYEYDLVNDEVIKYDNNLRQ